MKKAILTTMFLFPALVLCSCDSKKPAQTRLSDVDSVARARLHPITSNRPAVGFFEGAVLGNGGLGAIVTTRPDAVVIYFGHNDVWDIRLAEDNKEKIGTFSEIFEKVKAIPDTTGSLTDVKWYRDYLTTMRENYAKPYPRPFPCGSAVLWFDRREAELLGHRLNIDTGVCEIEFLIDGKISRLNVFADMENDTLRLIMVDESGEHAAAPFSYITLVPDPETPPELPKYTTSRNDSRGMMSFRQILPVLADEQTTVSTKHRPNPKDKAFSLTAQLNGSFLPAADTESDAKNPDSGPWIPGQERYSGPLQGVIDRTDGFYLCFRLDQGYASSVDLHSPEVPATDTSGYTLASEKSKKAWERFWNKSGVALDDEVLERTWYHNLYFFRCAVRPGVTCPGLFANWSHRNIGTAWHGEYHMNYNTQQPFWLTFSSNHTELHLPYVDMVEDYLLPVSTKWAREYYEMRGAFFPHSAYPVEMTIMPYPLPTWGWEGFETPWTVQSLWWHYKYTMDTAFLKDRAFGAIKEAVMFLVDYMKRPDAYGDQWGDENYHIFPSVPPELYGLQPGFDKNYDTNADLALTRFIFNAFIEACSVLDYTENEKELLADINDILGHYPDYPTAQSQRGKVFVSVEGEDPEVVYNCPASLMSIFPGEHHGLHSSAEDYGIAVNTFNNQQNEGGNDLIFLNIQAVRLGILDIEKFKRQIEYCLLPNGACGDKVLQIHGRYTNNTPFDWMGTMGLWFENFALPFVINECLLQSYNGELRFFPNWPDDKDAEFRSLRAMGAFLVSARWSGGNVKWIEIESEAGGELHIISPWESGAVCTGADAETILTGERYTLETKPGDVLVLKPAK